MCGLGYFAEPETQHKVRPFFRKVWGEGDRRVRRGSIFGVFNKVKVPAEDVPVRVVELAQHCKFCLSHRRGGR